MQSGDAAVLEARAAVSQALTRLLAEFYGKGPARARTYLFDDYVFAVCEDALTPAEEALLAQDDPGLIADLRLAFEDVMAKAFVGEVEQVLGRTVVGYHSHVAPEQRLLIEMFVLDPTQPGLAVGEGGGDWEPGEPGDADELPPPGAAPAPAPHTDRPRPRPEGQGELRATLGAAIARACQQLFGRGASRARAYVADRYVFCALEDPLTRAERTLAAGGRRDLVRRLRDRVLEGARDEFVAPVEALLGREVQAVASQVVFEPDVAFVLLVLDDRPDG